MTDVSPPGAHLFVTSAHAADHAVLERLWLMFHHDLSEFREQLPDDEGRFAAGQLERAWADSDWAAYVLRWGTRPVGLCLVRNLSGPARVMNAFFVVRGARRLGIGGDAVRQVVARHPGPWEIPFQEANATAARFWRRTVTEIAGSDWSQESRPVPHRPDLPPDVWISFNTPPPR